MIELANNSGSELATLEKECGYKISEVSFSEWKAITSIVSPKCMVNWGDSSGYQDQDIRYTTGATVCFAGIVFKKSSGVLIPNLYHFFPTRRKEWVIRKKLDCPAEGKVLGIVGSKLKSLETVVGQIYTRELSLTPITASPDGIFNILVSPPNKQIIYSLT